MRVLAAPTSLKGALSAVDAADALVAGLRRGGADADALPVADGGDGTLEVLHRALGGEWRSARVTAPLGGELEATWLLLPPGVCGSEPQSRTAVVESATVLGFHTVDRLDPLRASSRGLGELILATRATKLLVTLGGTVTVDGGAGMREVLDGLPPGTRVLCDVQSPLRYAAYVFAMQKGATLEQRDQLAERLRGLPDVPGAGAAGGLGAAFHALGAELVPGAAAALDLVGFDTSGYQLVVTGEGKVDATTFQGKAPGEVVRRCRQAGVRCELFSARDDFPGGPSRSREDLVAYGERLAGLG
jgi:glycerate kinase